MVDKVKTLCLLGTSDHISLNIAHALYTKSNIKRSSLNYSKGDFVSLRSMIKEAKPDYS